MSLDLPPGTLMRHAIANIARRSIAIDLALTLSMLVACSDSSTAPAGPPITTPSEVTVAYCPGSEPAWLAFQDGDGAWTRELPVTTGQSVTFHHTFMSNRGAIATGSIFGSGIAGLAIQYGTPDEIAALGDASAYYCGLTGSKTLLGSVAGLGANDIALVSAGYPFRGAVVSPLAGETFTLQDLANGPQVLLASRQTTVNGATTVTGFILRRFDEQPDGTSLPLLDFNSAEAFPPVMRNVTLAGIGAEGATIATDLFSAHSRSNIITFPTPTTAATRSYVSLPESRLEAGDLQDLRATTGPVGNVVRTSAVYFRSPVDRTLAFGAVPPAPAISVAAAAPSLRMRAHFVPHADYDRLTSINYQQGQNAIVSVSMSSAYAGLVGAYDLVMPDLSTVQGFDSRWTLRADGPTLLWTSVRVGGTLGTSFAAVPTDGATRRDASDAGFVTP
jgi:hypothetical protein